MKVQVPDVSIGRGQEWTEKAVERDRILAALSETMGNREKTAEKLGISRATLWRKIKEYGI
ncbi:MAG: helix-turn-helix domain-containing protein [Oribacterium sp.]|nr:helix-turn-helix domain-containing protein [Oribacterium sp.]